jgi:hypothetical protein
MIETSSTLKKDAKDKGLTPADYEFQLLYGIQTAEQKDWLMRLSRSLSD